MRDNARNWLEVADKVYHYRRDQLTQKESGELLQRSGELSGALKSKADAGRLKLCIESLEGVLRRTGGTIYPKSSLVENVEFFLVAAIVIIGVRTYFVQPFKIPTNSMWPTYYGMTADNLSLEPNPPSFLMRAFRFAAFGAQRREVLAPTDGEVTADFDENTGAMTYTLQRDHTWLVLPAVVKEYTFYVGDQPATVRVPQDFNDFDRVVWETFFGGERGFAQQFMQARELRSLKRAQRGLAGSEELYGRFRLVLGQAAHAKSAILRFDIMTGDQLFVDRISYHFFRPSVGQGFVFRTGHIEGIGDDQYYIKRLVGSPGDTLEIKEPVLYRNGSPITGSTAFQMNALRTAPYRGYFNARPGASQGGARQYLFRDEKIVVPPGDFMALGDNSHSSLDGRYWGFVPDKDAIGRPLFIYYPFTKRWGPAK